MDIIARPFGVLMEFIYNNLAFQNYGIAIIIFTIIMKILLVPLQIKQQRSTIKQQEMQPELEELKRTYANDRNKLAEEQQKLYAKYNVSMTAGCLPMLIQFPLLIGLYEVIRRPLTYISGLSAETIAKFAENVPGAVSGNVVNELVVNGALTAKDGAINMNFLKVFDLGITPDWKVWSWGADWKVFLPLFFIPVLSFASAMLMQYATTSKMRKEQKASGQKQGGTANLLLKLMPLMSLFIAFAVPAGLGFYWTISNVLSLAQTVFINKIFAKQKERLL